MTIQSCSTCPNFVTDEVNGLAIGKCRELRQTIFVQDVSPAGHLEDIAKQCPSFGVETTETPVWFPVIEPELDGSMPGEILSDCRSCVNYVNASDRPYGTPIGLELCGATGAAIDSSSSCNGCPFAKQGFPTDKPGKVYLPILSDPSEVSKGNAVTKKVAVRARASADAGASYIAPDDYETDLPLTEEDKGFIRAWRAVEVGDGAKRQTAYLPIFERDHFAPELQHFIPETGGDDHPELYHVEPDVFENVVVESFLNDEPLCLVGEPGAGKTELARYLAWLMQAPFTHLQLNEESILDEILGSTVLTADKGTQFRLGTLPTAISEAGVTLSDEINTAPDAIKQGYRSLLSASRAIYLDMHPDPLKRVVKKNSWHIHMLALNPSWDARNLGTRELADADVSRLSFLWVEEPGDEEIAKIILAKLEAEGLSISDDELAGMLSVRKDIKELARAGALPFSWSIRQDVKVAKKMAYYAPGKAYKRALTDYCTPDSAEAVNKVVQSVFGF